MTDTEWQFGKLIVPPPVDVRLSWAEVQRAACIGVARHFTARAKGRQNNGEWTAGEWTSDVLGAWGECAVAKAAGLYWPIDDNEPDGAGPDVGDWHVRTRSKANDELGIKPKDRDEDRFVLVVQLQVPTFRIVGWCFAHEGRRDEYAMVAKGQRTYFVPHRQLRPFRP